LHKNTRRKITSHVTMRKNVYNIYYIFRACARSDLLPTFHKVKSFSKLRYVSGARSAYLLYEARTILPFRSSTLTHRVA